MLKINNLKWVKRFSKLYDLQDVNDGSQWMLLKTIQPVLSMEEQPSPGHMKLSGDLQGVVGTYVAMYTLAEDECMDVYGAYREGTTANSKIAISDGSNVIELTASSTGATAYTFGKIRLIRGWSIGMFATGNAGDATRYLHIIADIKTRKLDRGSSGYYVGDLNGGAF